MNVLLFTWPRTKSLRSKPTFNFFSFKNYIALNLGVTKTESNTTVKNWGQKRENSAASSTAAWSIDFRVCRQQNGFEILAQIQICVRVSLSRAPYLLDLLVHARRAACFCLFLSLSPKRSCCSSGSSSYWFLSPSRRLSPSIDVVGNNFTFDFIVYCVITFKKTVSILHDYFLTNSVNGIIDVAISFYWFSRTINRVWNLFTTQIQHSSWFILTWHWGIDKAKYIYDKNTDYYSFQLYNPLTVSLDQNYKRS